MSDHTPTIFLCNGAVRSTVVPQNAKIVSLSYLRDDPNRNVNLQLPRFIDEVFHLPDRILDLLEIADWIRERGGAFPLP